MKTVLVFACWALAFVGAVVVPKPVYKTEPVDNDFIVKQKKIFNLFIHPEQVDPEAEYYRIGKDYDIEAHIDDYSDKKVVQVFVDLWRTGFLSKNVPFSIFYERQRQEVVALFNILYSAKDFEIFYKTAAFARVHINEGQFLYAYYISLIHRVDSKAFVVPAPYEIYPELFSNSNVWYKIFRVKMQNGIITPDFGSENGVVREEDRYVVYSNYSDYVTYPNGEQRISYFSEDVGLNAFYYHFQSYFPFWMGSEFFPVIKDRRGEIYYYVHQQLLARYYLERLSNGLGEIPEFSWWQPIKTGYIPYVNYFNSLVQRPSNYQIPNEKYEELQFLDAYEKTFIQYLLQNRVQSVNQGVNQDVHDSTSMNFVGNFWQANANVWSKVAREDNHNYYEVIARRILGAAPEPVDKYNIIPSALDFYQTSLRDPMFYQLYSKILKYIIEYKQALASYKQDSLHYVGVKINDVKIDKLVTYFDYFDYDVSSNVFYNKEELKSQQYPWFVVRQPRLNHKPFAVNIDVKSDVEGEAVFKIFLGPKYNSKGYPISLEDNWQNFVEWDWFVQKLNKGQNKVVRQSSDFINYKDDSVSVRDVLKLLEESKVPANMTNEYGSMPKRLLVPKGSLGGFPYQIFVMVYPYSPVEKKFEGYKSLAIDNKPYGYPFDRPVHEAYFKQPNMFWEDVMVYHEGEELSYKYNIPYYSVHHNEVVKH